MPQYLAPGVYVEEISGPRTIAGVSTTTAAFVGPTRYGPTSGRPRLLTSYADYVRIYGDAVDLDLDDSPTTNHMAIAVRGFFEEGGGSLYVARLFEYADADLRKDHATATFGATSKLPAIARFPGQAGRVRATFTLRVGNSIKVGQGSTSALTRVRPFDTVWVPNSATPGAAGKVYVVAHNPATDAMELVGQGSGALDLTTLVAGVGVHLLTVLVETQTPTLNRQGQATYGPRTAVGEFGFDQRAIGTGVTTVLTANPPSRGQAMTVPIAFEPAASLPNDPAKWTVAVVGEIFTDAILKTATEAATSVEERQVTLVFAGGGDGDRPTSTTYEGSPMFVDLQAADTVNPNPADSLLNGLLAFEPIEDISTVCAPGAAGGWGAAANTVGAYTQAVNSEVVTHCERMQYRTAALDTPAGLLPGDALDFRNLGSSTHASLYYPWLTVAHPVDGNRINVPPAPFMTGIWARSDNARGVIKAPANEPVRSALDLEIRLNKPQQELLNPQGVNCLRYFPGSGFLVWGARTISDDPEWKYLNLRRYFNYVEKSIDEGTQWCVFEINGPALWDAVRHTVEGFLLNEWRSGALLGSKPEHGFFVRCDASTMTSDDLDQGRLICVVGIAAARPAEFVIFRIGQLTATTA
ncbi:phage tail sheath subtilisin-like domain-containing protein [Nocardioides sp.]|uniref:phage tail sheath subtilisin-like domain-containing protein n=1 Tax=Nocardioides sp. TaxID=35761 RepID=UPI002CA5F3FF|nr:phage tail sheath subtilisin-like domain-containing protein [Nocardioides sp.]HXH78138.1 phage tail sheath subtilisin-like domain-containing protein [Nocardioides sp.]